MGYQIRYGKRNRGYERWLRLVGGSFVCFLAFCAITLRFWRSGRRELLSLFPFLKTGEAALEKMVADLRSGIPIAESVSVFVRDVFGNAKLG